MVNECHTPVVLLFEDVVDLASSIDGETGREPGRWGDGVNSENGNRSVVASDWSCRKVINRQARVHDRCRRSDTVEGAVVSDSDSEMRLEARNHCVGSLALLRKGTASGCESI
jgi:hypothetical protein